MGKAIGKESTRYIKRDGAWFRADNGEPMFPTVCLSPKPSFGARLKAWIQATRALLA